jgi:hypothetical protein
MDYTLNSYWKGSEFEYLIGYNDFSWFFSCKHQANIRHILRTGHDRFLPDPLKFIIHPYINVT